MVDPGATTGASTNPPREAAPANPLSSAWWVPLLAGALNLVAGLVVLIEPHNTLLAIALVLGIYLVIAGVFVVMTGLARPDRRWVVVFLGVLGIVAGGFVIARPGSAVHGVRIVLGIYFLLAGCAHLGAAALLTGDRLAEIVRGALDLIAGLIFLFAPKLGLAALALFVGVYLVLRGGLEVALALTLREAARRTGN